jgi:hypothetical protein
MKLITYFSLLLISSIALHGMEPIHHDNDLTKMVLYNPDIVSCITQQLYLGHFVDVIKKDFKSLVLTNTFFCDYYSIEQNKQMIIQTVVRHYRGSEVTIARLLGCRSITKKINYFWDIADSREKQFTEEDLEQTWYLNLNYPRSGSLLYRIIQNHDYEKAELLLNNPKFEIKSAVNIYFTLRLHEFYLKANNDIEKLEQLKRIGDSIEKKQLLLKQSQSF